jgi:hypothetical protein
MLTQLFQPRYLHQILYLDSLELGVLKMDHNLFPRISAFDAERIKRMIRADCKPSASNSVDHMFGRSEVKHVCAKIVKASNIVYGRRTNNFNIL